MPMTGARPARPPALKRFGQHFLEAAWVSKVVACIRPAQGEVFLEIGAGAGQLTLPLAAAGAEVVAVEKDRRLADRLRAVAPSSVRVVAADVLDEDLAGLVAGARPHRAGRPARVAGNLPYNVSTPILRRLVETHHRDACFADATLMLQREVADRVVGRPGSRDYGPLAIVTRAAAHAERVLALPPAPSARPRACVRRWSACASAPRRRRSPTARCSNGWSGPCSRNGARRCSTHSRPWSARRRGARRGSCWNGRMWPRTAAPPRSIWPSSPASRTPWPPRRDERDLRRRAPRDTRPAARPAVASGRAA